MDIRALLEKMYKFAGEPEQKPGDQVKGTEKARSTKSGKDHPFKGRLVGASESRETTLLQDLSKLSEEMAVENRLREMWAEFQEALLGTETKRPARTGSRPNRGHEPQPRYKQVSADKNESRGHKVIARKLKDIERSKNPSTEPDLKSREVQAKADYAKYVAKMKKKNPNYVPLYKIDEYGAEGAAGADAMSPADKEELKKAMAATTQLKSATSSPAPADKLMKALDTASQGKAVGSQEMKALEPMMGVVAQAATDPKLAAQFKNLAAQARQVAQQQQKEKQQTQKKT